MVSLFSVPATAGPVVVAAVVVVAVVVVVVVAAVVVAVVVVAVVVVVGGGGGDLESSVEKRHRHSHLHLLPLLPLHWCSQQGLRSGGGCYDVLCLGSGEVMGPSRQTQHYNQLSLITPTQ